jgi:hypothetical protein
VLALVVMDPELLAQRVVVLVGGVAVPRVLGHEPLGLLQERPQLQSGRGFPPVQESLLGRALCGERVLRGLLDAVLVGELGQGGNVLGGAPRLDLLLGVPGLLLEGVGVAPGQLLKGLGLQLLEGRDGDNEREGRKRSDRGRMWLLGRLKISS